MSLLSEGQPNYTLRADSVFGYDNDDWLHTPLLPPAVVLGLTHEQIEETLKYFCECCFMYTLHRVVRVSPAAGRQAASVKYFGVVWCVVFEG